MSVILSILCSYRVYINLDRGSHMSVIFSILCSHVVYTNLHRGSNRCVIFSIHVLCSTIPSVILVFYHI